MGLALRDRDRSKGIHSCKGQATQVRKKPSDIKIQGKDNYRYDRSKVESMVGWEEVGFPQRRSVTS